MLFRSDPAILLADEPTGELHSEDRKAVITLLQALHAQGRTVIIVTHDMEVASVAKRRIEIRDGQVSELGQPSSPPRDGSAPLASAPRSGALVEHGGRGGGRRRQGGFPWLSVILVSLLVAVGLGGFALGGGILPGGAAPTPTAVVETARVARGEVHPEQEARLQSITPGTEIGRAHV